MKRLVLLVAMAVQLAAAFLLTACVSNPSPDKAHDVRMHELMDQHEADFSAAPQVRGR